MISEFTIKSGQQEVATGTDRPRCLWHGEEAELAGEQGDPWGAMPPWDGWWLTHGFKLWLKWLVCLMEFSSRVGRLRLS